MRLGISYKPLSFLSTGAQGELYNDLHHQVALFARAYQQNISAEKVQQLADQVEGKILACESFQLLTTNEAEKYLDELHALLESRVR